MSTGAETLEQFFPATSRPLICNAPMAGATNARMAVAVAKAGGLGLIGGGADFTASSPELANLRQQLIYARELLRIVDSNAPLPIGIGCLTMKSDTWNDNFVQLVNEHRPVAVWLFACTHRSQHTELIQALQTTARDWGLKVIVQVGTMESAREAIDDGADILSVQGSDAGGHQFKQGAGLMTLLPDVADMVRSEYPERNIPLLAAGGIMDGRGAAAALMLGASGIVMGTRFLCTTECPVPDQVKATLIATQDGASSTLKSRVHDEIQGRAEFWPSQYSGRAIVSDVHRKWDAELNKNKDLDMNRAPPTVVWAGAGVGQIGSVVDAGTLVTNTQAQARQLIQAFKT
ncbi:nitronate monooxygenase [Aspergillus novofumigatus IBT 16806]|uniref:Putative 2-nitropropane dioxygenase family oxidoreductase n=1 Tax=Aspergillus novofumigatus (strain IBT 16806) TaxID=1392255 RepID=A0A2I1BU70_ASPN1|nr:putative 2-nitropropane dioxygenase family oxidoreductase [Aspergillus novofumigatus IBT 16806]PKX88925.1 putative 2-nitropropane dioxygenase family oxidoreductase [Aspergillus novofumigatus IBT 16806]